MKKIYQTVDKILRLIIISVFIQNVIIRRIKPVFKPLTVHWGAKVTVFKRVYKQIAFGSLHRCLYFYRVELNKRIVNTKLFIDKHFALPVDLDTLSAEACVSKFHFIRTFKKSYNRTPHQYLTQKRIDKAKELLCKPKYSINTVCQRVGFESQQTFAQKFKQHTGHTPTQYRRMCIVLQNVVKTAPARVIPFCFLSKLGPEGILDEI
ncbi:MAG: helix-turn-helix transcriptional regulator [Bacteroidetes bacterium]|nr:MAG: helix-turn-helix transcriptional regulator [Bacteroidota bacterium]